MHKKATGPMDVTFTYQGTANPSEASLDGNQSALARSGNGHLAPVPAVRAACELPADAVPTDVVQGPDGAWYVSQLVGFPFERGSSTIWRVVPGSDPEPYATD